jgi:predicted PhzF superfamily epimerase YddE/YHI9
MRVEIDIPEERIACLFVSAIEGGSNYWIKEISRTPYAADYQRDVDLGPGQLFLRLPFTVTEDRSEEQQEPLDHVITEEDVRQALAIMAGTVTAQQRNVPSRHFAEFVNENEDAETGDVFLQLCIFREIKYG